MAHRTAARQAPGIRRRRTFAAHLFGLSPDTAVPALKEYLHAARLTSSPTEQLDLVMVEDYDHFTELIAQHGVPLARDDIDTYPRSKTVVTLRVRPISLLLISALLVLNVLDDVLGAFDITVIPWF